MRGGEGGRGGTGAISRTVHVNKVRFADVKQFLFIEKSTTLVVNSLQF